jgi:hypothetical protein
MAYACVDKSTTIVTEVFSEAGAKQHDGRAPQLHFPLNYLKHELPNIRSSFARLSQTSNTIS